MEVSGLSPLSGGHCAITIAPAHHTYHHDWIAISNYEFATPPAIDDDGTA